MGAGTPALPKGVRVTLELLDERRFGNGTVFLRYRTKGVAPLGPQWPQEANPPTIAPYRMCAMVLTMGVAGP